MNDSKIFCVFCGASISAKAGSTSDVLECPACSHLTPIPPAPGKESLRWAPIYPPDIVAVDVIFHCPKCETRLGSDARTAGTHVYCPPCGTRVQVPHLHQLILSTAEEKKPLPAAEATLSAAELEFLNNVTHTGWPPAKNSEVPCEQTTN